MTRYVAILAALIGSAALGAIGTQGRGQGAQQQQQQQQQQQAQQTQQQQQHQMQMQQMMQRMDQITSRTQTLSQTMTRQMDRLRTQDRDHTRLLLQLCDAVGAQARETRRSMDRIHQMMQDQTMSRDHPSGTTPCATTAPPRSACTHPMPSWAFRLTGAGWQTAIWTS